MGSIHYDYPCFAISPPSIFLLELVQPVVFGHRHGAPYGCVQDFIRSLWSGQQRIYHFGALINVIVPEISLVSELECISALKPSLVRGRLSLSDLPQQYAEKLPQMLGQYCFLIFGGE